ncbi:AMIN domain-containing protein [Plectonema radiosum NIES-515]|uniref:AMIN domain-containing protein n=1 Tax=Plectonema radiosum NIES-515 TaxID=2986073 RepID=A0ABT3AWM0_9CYAN|nr:AMIN domain-containing protein [Plectonema radiosum]MCV3213522.1 AMIN domain-containing protein [Plectonema radiosum NIES-515]
MKQLHGNSFILAAAAFVFVAVQPVSAQTSEITDVQLNPVDGGINVVLKTSSGSRPQVFTTKRGKSLVADIINTQLRLPQGNSFRQDNPAPGITSVAINQLDTNSIRVTVIGEKGVPNTQPVKRGGSGITLSYSPGTEVAAEAPIPAAIAASNPSRSAPLVPNPQVTVDGTPAQASGPGQPGTAAPPFLPRAVAPPVGDIAISNTDASPSVIDLGTQERVPRLVLRDAPVREVLSLLARAANLNLAYTSGGQGADGKPAAAAGGDGPTISLDIENEPVQDVFNYVLRLSGLEANRSGRTIFVGANLPNATRDTVMRNLRLNQVTVSVAVNFLVGLGAESAVSQERKISIVRSSGKLGDDQSTTTESSSSSETSLQTRRAEFKDSTPLLRGLQALGEERTNSLTLIGPPKLVEIAMAQLGQLDIRRRQVAVNVKIVDVNLLNTHDSNTSFSFGVGNNFFTNDGGAASLNFGGSRPATSAEARNSITSTPVITNPITGKPFLDPNSFVQIPGTTPGTVVVDPNGNITRVANPGSGSFYQPITPDSNGNSLQPGFSDITPATDNIITRNADGTSSITRGTLGTATTSLPTLFQFPKRFLASLQAQVTSGNAKILTDPTLIVQEGQTADLKLTQEVVGNIERAITRGDGTSSEIVTAKKESVGLTLAVKVERIDDNGFVSLSVAPTVASPQAPADISTGNGSSQRIFLVSTRSLNSGVVRLRDGQTLILSGIIQDSDRTSVSKIPILGDIPLLGSLFRKTNRSNQRQEVIVLLTPQIMDDSERSSYGYNYTPSPEVRGTLERSGLKVPK